MTKQTKHTPGPWTIKTQFSSKRIFTPLDRIEITAGNGHIASLYQVNWRSDGSIDAANARLIATAPDGLELARLCLELEQNGPAMEIKRLNDHMESIIAKARTIIAAVDGAK